jgi:hypothetical protein
MKAHEFENYIYKTVTCISHFSFIVVNIGMTIVLFLDIKKT